MPKSIRRLLAVPLAALVLALPAPAAHADELDPTSEEGPKTVIKYATCASSLALAPTFSAAIAAFMYCAQTFLDEFSP